MDADLVSNAMDSEMPVEVILWSMYYLKKNPNSSIKEAIDVGYAEWIK